MGGEGDGERKKLSGYVCKWCDECALGMRLVWWVV